MACLSQANDPSEPPTCRALGLPLQQGAHYESGLEEGEEYFFVLMTPTDPNSFVSMSDYNRVAARPLVERPLVPFGAPNQPRPRNTPEQFCKLCPGPTLLCYMLTYGFAALESPLDMLDLRTIDTSRLYKAGNSKNVQAFIGFMKGEPSHPEESRKRRRMD